MCDEIRIGIETEIIVDLGRLIDLLYEQTPDEELIRIVCKWLDKMPPRGGAQLAQELRSKLEDYCV